MTKLNARDRAQLVVFAYRNGLASMPGVRAISTPDVRGTPRSPDDATPSKRTVERMAATLTTAPVGTVTNASRPTPRCGGRRRGSRSASATALRSTHISFSVPVGDGRRAGRPERRRQDHDHGDAARARAADARHGHGVRQPDRAGAAATCHRVGPLIEGPAFHPAVSGIDNLRVAGDPAAGPADRRHRRADRHRRPDRPRRRPLRRVLAGDEAAPRHRRRAARRPAARDPRRADQRARPDGDAGHPRPDRRRSAGRAATVIVSSHLLRELEQVCDWLIVLDRGGLVHAGPTSALGAAETVLAHRRRARRPRPVARRSSSAAATTWSPKRAARYAWSYPSAPTPAAGRSAQRCRACRRDRARARSATTAPTSRPATCNSSTSGRRPGARSLDALTHEPLADSEGDHR